MVSNSVSKLQSSWYRPKSIVKRNGREAVLRNTKQRNGKSRSSQDTYETSERIWVFQRRITRDKALQLVYLRIIKVKVEVRKICDSII